MIDAYVLQRWTANGTDGVLRDNPDRAETPSVRLPAGTPIVSFGELVTPDGNNWRAAEWPVGSRAIKWFLRKGPGVPADHDFIAGEFAQIETQADLDAARAAGYGDAKTKATAIAKKAAADIAAL
jgi:hypothetical protein